MIISRIMGGLGNQMFQYAVGRNLAKKLDTELKLDIEWFSDGEKKREYSLSRFNIQGTVATEKEIDEITKRGKSISGKILRRILTTVGIQENRWIKEKHYHFDQSVLDLPDNVYLHGYWQSYKYFHEIDSIIQKDFSLKEELSENSLRMCEQIFMQNSVSLHIRRGDYIHSDGVSKVFYSCDQEYYKNACLHIAERFERPVFFIFSDDLDWVNENLKLPYPTVFVEGNTALEDLVLISRCRHNIMANSSFSFWGAWLNTNPDKIVIAPEKWFKDPSRIVDDQIPSEWVRL